MANTKHYCPKEHKDYGHYDRELVYLRIGPKGQFQRITRINHKDPDPRWKSDKGSDDLEALYFCQECFKEGKDPLSWGYCRGK